MARHVFRYKPVQGRLAPMITVGIKLEETWYPIGMYVDSGAAYALLHANIAQGAGFPYRTGQRVIGVLEDSTRRYFPTHVPVLFSEEQ